MGWRNSTHGITHWSASKTRLNKSDVVIKTAEPASTRDTTEILLNTLDSTYDKTDLKQAANNATSYEC